MLAKEGGLKMADKKIAQGNGNYIRGLADKISHKNGYRSMWRWCGKPILRNDRFYYLYEDEKLGLLYVTRGLIY